MRRRRAAHGPPSSRLRRAQAFWPAGRRPPDSFAAQHEIDVFALRTLVVRVLESSRLEIEAEVAAVREQRTRDLWLVGLQIALGILLAAWVMRRLARQTVRPLARLGVAADRLRAGDGRVRVQIGGPVELERMGSTFNEMADTLEVQQGGLRRLAYTDALTGLPNRAAILERVEAAVAANGAPALLTSAPSPAASSPWATGWTCG